MTDAMEDHAPAPYEDPNRRRGYRPEVDLFATLARAEAVPT
jgi:hypothetical protein